MKIGILTYHRAENYGALLQAFALMTFLKQQGHEVSFVDYWPQYHIDHYKIFNIHKFWTKNLRYKLAMIKDLLLWSSLKWMRKKRLASFMKKHLCLDDAPQYTNDNSHVSGYDEVVYGSDQIWRKQDSISDIGFNPWYFASEHITAPKKIAYAASMGHIYSDKDDVKELQGMLGYFDKISVREAELRDFLERIGFKSEFVCDPVFLLDKEVWEATFIQKTPGKRYILVYNLLDSSETVAFANELSHKTGLPIKEITMRYDLAHIGTRYVKTASVERFLNLIANASYVVGNSFHGVAFSIIFERQFFAVGMGDKAGRVLSLLNCAGIPERLMDTIDGLDKEMADIDFNEVRQSMRDYIESSKHFLAAH